MDPKTQAGPASNPFQDQNASDPSLTRLDREQLKVLRSPGERGYLAMILAFDALVLASGLIAILVSDQPLAGIAGVAAVGLWFWFISWFSWKMNLRSSGPWIGGTIHCQTILSPRYDHHHLQPARRVGLVR